MTITPRSKRHNLYFLSAYDALSGDALGQLSDISTEGISILSDTQLQCPRTYRLRILVPQGDRPDLSLEFEAESRWTSADAGSYTTGFHITFLTDEQRTQIEKIVNNYGYAKIGDVKVAREPAPRETRPGGLRRLLQTLFTQ
jgi:hypothetical protein